MYHNLDDGKMHERHLLQLLSGIIEWVDPPDAVSKAIESGKSERSGDIHPSEFISLYPYNAHLHMQPPTCAHTFTASQIYLFKFNPQIGAGFIQRDA